VLLLAATAHAQQTTPADQQPATSQPQTGSPQQPSSASAPAQRAPASGSQSRNGAPFNATAGLTLVEGHHWHWDHIADLEIATGVRLYADAVDYFDDTNKLVASGNVVFVNPEGQLSAESIEFNTDTMIGTFHKAWAVMTLPKADRMQFGNQDPDVYFYGDTIDKIGPRRYRIKSGWFTTCVQPTPRWEMVSDHVTLNLDDYAISENTVLTVKGVPLFYLPVLYYPIRNQDRATGFLLPTYGTSTIRGQAISNAFFWAIDRSQDATFFHDWFTRAGQGLGSEYRYVASAQSFGNIRFYRFSQKESSFTQLGNTTTQPASTIYTLTSAVTQKVGPNMRAQVNVDYFSDVFLQQLYHQNFYQATQAQTRVTAGLTGVEGPFSTGMYYSRSEVFSSKTSSSIYGTTPRLTASLAPQRLFGSLIYGSFNSDYSYLPNRTVNAGVTTADSSIGRLDFAPSVRAPLSKLTFLTVNTTAGYRTTYYSREVGTNGALVPNGVLRQYFSTRTDVIGPVFAKIWDTPGRATIQRMKHVIEPTFALEYVTDFSNQASLPKVPSDPTDYVVGGSARYTYGLTNRFLYRERPRDGRTGTTREFVSIGVQQTYYTNADSSRFDPTYVTSTSRVDSVHLSPVALTARVSPSALIDSNTRVEYDTNGNGMQSLSSGARLTLGSTSTSLNYSRQHLVPTSPKQSFMTSSTTLTQRQWRGTYVLNWDISRAYIVSQSVIGTYMAQCCGLQFEVQDYHYPANAGYPVSSDRRFNFGFVLAGLGTFSNFFGAFGGLSH
jgi:lipopolysaccharide assembly outer membrane protein LptD (OstA)